MSQIEIGTATIDWTQLSTKESRDKLEAAKLRAEQVVIEDIWRESEMELIADQLIAIEDGDPDALPVNETQWRAYRTKVRAWKDGGNPEFPDPTKRPYINKGAQ